MLLFTELIKDMVMITYYKHEPDIANTKGTYIVEWFMSPKHLRKITHLHPRIFIKALESNGMKLNLFEEFDYCPYKLEGMIEKEK